jgi:hypothetical protein
MKKISIIILSAFSLTLASCKKDWLNVNTNPNNPTVTTSDLVFTNAVNTTISTLGQHQLGSFWGGVWSRSTSFIAGAADQTYAFSNADFNFWTGYYNNLFDYEYVSNNAATDGRPHLKFYAEVMKAMLFQQLVDLYGNIPYTNALKGSGVLQPAYDDAKTIYEDLIKKLDAAITGINAATVTAETSDIIFAGNKVKWVRFANTLKMRILMRQSTIPGRDSYILPEIQKIVSGGGLLAAGEDVTATPGYQSGSAGKINPFYNAFGYDQNNANVGGTTLIRMSALLVNQLKNTFDTFRLKRIVAVRPDSNGVQKVVNYTGIPNGATGATWVQAATSHIGPHQIVLGEQTKPMVIMTVAEARFLAAEAKQRWPAAALPNTAQSYYEDGVRESFRITGTAASAATALLTGGTNNADFAASANKLDAIAIQKWIALTNYDGLELWSENRKSNVPVVPLSIQASKPTAPVRLFYPLVELNTNSANVPTTGVDVFANKVFWDL